MVDYAAIHAELDRRFAGHGECRIIMQSGVPLAPMPTRPHDMRAPDGIKRSPNPALERKPERAGTPWCRSSKAIRPCQCNPDRSGVHGWRKNGVDKVTGKPRTICRWCQCTGYAA